MSKSLIKKLLCLMTMMLALAFSAQAVDSRASEQSGLGDVNGDGEVTIADVSALIDLLVTGETTTAGDLNGDGEINIADINALIDMLLNGYVDPHDTGYWLIVLDKNREPIWYELYDRNIYGDYVTTLSLEDRDTYGDPWEYYSETGKYLRTSIYIKIDGVLYGAENDNEDIILGTALDNPLIPSNNSYIIPVGYNYNVGVAREDNLYIYAAQAGFASN